MRRISILCAAALLLPNGVLGAEWDGKSYRGANQEVTLTAMAQYHCSDGAVKRYLPQGFDCVRAETISIQDERCMAWALQQEEFSKARSQCDAVRLEASD